MSSTFQWDCSVAARPPEGTVFWPLSLLALPPASPPAGRGRPAGLGPASPFLALGPTAPLPSPEGHCHWGHCPPFPLLSPTLGSPLSPSLLFHPRPAPGPRHVDFAFWRQFLELSPLVLPSHKLSAHVAPWHHGTGSLPGNRNPGLQRGVQPSPSHFYSPDAGWTCLSLSPQDPSCPQGQLPPLPRPGTAFLWPCCVFL